STGQLPSTFQGLIGVLLHGGDFEASACRLGGHGRHSSPPSIHSVAGRWRIDCARAGIQELSTAQGRHLEPCPPGAVPVETNVENLVDRPPSRHPHRPVAFAANALRSALISLLRRREYMAERLAHAHVTATPDTAAEDRPPKEV